MSDPVFRPLLFRRLDEIGREGIEIHDSLEAQLRDLIKTRNPSRKLSSDELDELVKAHLGGRSLSEYGVWVYYPWSRRLVHLLDESEFVELRTNRNCYKITPLEQAELSRKRIGIVGLSVGQSVALTLALERGFGELRLADFDHLDLSNLNRLRAGVHNLGMPKVYVTAREIAEIDPFLNVKCFPEGLSGDDYDFFLMEGGKLDLLIEECDSIDVKIRVRQQCRRHRIPVLMDTSDRGLLDIERFDLEPERQIFHGLIGDPDPAHLAGLSMEQKIPYVLKIIGEDSLSARMRGSMIEVESSIGTWPQLASSVTLGGALAADLSRRVLLDHCRVSGRYYVDLSDIVPDVPAKEVSVPFEPAPPRLTPAQMAAQATQVDLPSSGVPREELLRMVGDAILAPSGGNSQPWIWYWDGRLHLFHDRSRSHSLLDFESLGAFAALGAAWENLELSAHRLGWRLRERVLPGGDIAVSFSFERGTEESEFDSLYEFVALRNTNRRLQGRRALSGDAIAQMNAAAASAGAAIHWITADRDLDAAGELLGAGDRVRLLNQELHRHMMSELRFTSEEAARTGDGISVSSLELGPGDSAGIRISRSWEALSLVRSLNGGHNLTKMSRKAIQSSSAVGMLCMPQNTTLSFLQGGRALQRVWLTATRLRVACHPMTALPYLMARLTSGEGRGLDEFTRGELSRLLPDYRALFPVPGGHVMLFRAAIADAPSERAHRRPLGDCLVEAPAYKR